MGNLLSNPLETNGAPVFNKKKLTVAIFSMSVDEGCEILRASDCMIDKVNASPCVRDPRYSKRPCTESHNVND